VYHTTGFTKNQIIELCILVNERCTSSGSQPWPPILGWYKSTVVALTYLRRNRVQAEIAEAYDVSQSTISRAVATLTPLLGAAVAEFTPVAGDLDPRQQHIVDGTLLPCWSWAGHRKLYSGKHKTTGLSVQRACRLDGGLAWICDPINGSRHDTVASRTPAS
jgi:hypothetical protein